MLKTFDRSSTIRIPEKPVAKRAFFFDQTISLAIKRVKLFVTLTILTKPTNLPGYIVEAIKADWFNL